MSSSAGASSATSAGLAVLTLVDARVEMGGTAAGSGNLVLVEQGMEGVLVVCSGALCLVGGLVP